MDVDSFVFIVEIIEDKQDNKIVILRSRPEYFIFPSLFTHIKIENNKILIGNQKQAIFEIDIASKALAIRVNAKELIKEWALCS